MPLRGSLQRLFRRKPKAPPPVSVGAKVAAAEAAHAPVPEAAPPPPPAPSGVAVLVAAAQNAQSPELAVVAPPVSTGEAIREGVLYVAKGFTGQFLAWEPDRTDASGKPARLVLWVDQAGGYERRYQVGASTEPAYLHLLITAPADTGRSSGWPFK